MKKWKTGFKTWVLIVMMSLMAVGAIVYKFDLIRIKPVYATENSETAAVQTANHLSDANNSSVPSPDNQSVVAIVKSQEAKAEKIQYPEIKEMVRRAVDLAGGFAGLIKDGQTVVIKPNLVTPIDYTFPNWGGKPLSPEVNGTTTDYRVTRAVVELVRQYNPKGKVYIMEGSAFPTRQCMNRLNYTPKYIPGVDEFVCIEEDSGAWRDYNSPNIVKVPVKDSLLKKEVYMNKRYKNADVVISVPVLKTHWTEVVSGSIKNVGIGATPATIYGGEQPGSVNRTGGLDHDKTKLDKWIHDWFMARPIQFTVIDGLQGIQNGPTPCYEMTKTTDIRQDQMNSRLILASRDCVAADTVESLIMQWDPAAVGYLGHLDKSGVGHSNVRNIRVAGKQVDEVRQDFKGTAPVGKIANQSSPRIEIKSAVMGDHGIHMKVAADQRTVKAELYLEGKYMGTVIPADPRNWTIELNGIDPSKFKNDIILKFYDKYLYCTEKQVRVINDPKHDVANAVLYLDESNYSAHRAEQAPVINGKADDPCWNQAEWKDLKYPWGSVTALPNAADFSGRYKLVWTAEKLYLLAEIRDDVLADSHPDPLDRYWEDDALEIFIDEDHSGGDHTYNYNAFAYHIALDYNVVDLAKAGFMKPALFNSHIVCHRTGGHPVSVWEAAIDVFDDSYDDKSSKNRPVILFAGKQLGFGLAYCDSDKSTREHFIGSMPMPPGQDYGWQNADAFATLNLIE